MAPKLKPEEVEERKTQIIASALACFARKGYHQTTMDDIVEEAGLSKGGVYWHFGSKKELFLALFESLGTDIESRMLTALEAGSTVREKLNTALESFVALATDAQFQELMPLFIDVWAQNWRDPEVNEVASGIYRQFRRPLVQIIEEGIAEGEFKPVDSSALAGVLLALYDGLIVQWMINPEAVDWTAVSKTLRDTLVAGLVSDMRFV